MTYGPMLPMPDGRSGSDTSGVTTERDRIRTYRPLGPADRASARRSRRRDRSENYTSPEHAIAERFPSLAPTVFLRPIGSRPTSRSTAQRVIDTVRLILRNFAHGCEPTPCRS